MHDLAYPIKLYDWYTCQGSDANGDQVVFDDLLSEGDKVGPSTDPDGGEAEIVTGVVERRPDGLWAVAL